MMPALQQPPFQPDSMRRIHCAHFVGIGGAGMGGIAEVLLNLGYKVTGSDLRENAVTRRLADQGAAIWIGHESGHVADCDVVVVSSAVDEHNPAAVPPVGGLRTACPVIQRADDYVGGRANGFGPGDVQVDVQGRSYNFNGSYWVNDSSCINFRVEYGSNSIYSGSGVQLSYFKEWR